MQALVRSALACAVVLWCAVAQADAIKHPSGFTFNLPDIGKNWEQEKKGDLFIVSDESDTLPELTVYVFPPKQEGTLDEIQNRLASEVTRLTLDGEAIKTAKVVYAKNEPVADTTAVRGTMTLNSTNAVFAIVQRGGKSLILVGVPKEGIFDRGSVNFREVVRGLQKGNATTATPPSQGTGETAKVIAEMMPEIVLVKEVTATSTFVDKKRKDAYAPTNVLWHTDIQDATLGAIPKTAWCEGKPDEGVGEALTISFARPEKVDLIFVSAGVWLNEKLFNANNQITSLDVILDGGKPTTVTVPAKREPVKVPIGKTVSTITLKVAAVKKGKMNDTCISAVDIERLVGESRASIVRASDLSADALGALPKSLLNIQSALASPDFAPLQNVVDFPFTWGKKFASWKALEAQCKKKGGDATKSAKCPSGVFFQRPTRTDLGKLEVATEGPGALTLSFPWVSGTRDVWKLKWRDGAWRLTSANTETQTRD